MKEDKTQRRRTKSRWGGRKINSTEVLQSVKIIFFFINSLFNNLAILIFIPKCFNSGYFMQV